MSFICEAEISITQKNRKKQASEAVGTDASESVLQTKNIEPMHFVTANRRHNVQ